MNKNFFRNIKVLFWILEYLRPYKNKVILFILLGLFSLSIELIIPKSIQYLIDHIIPSQRKASFVYFGCAFVVFSIVSLVSKCKTEIYKRQIQELAIKDLRSDFLSYLSSLNFKELDNMKSGDLYKKCINDINYIQKVYRYYFPTIVQTSIFSLIAITLMLYTNWILTLCTLPFLLLYLIIGPSIEIKADISSKNFSSSEGSYINALEETVSSISNIKMYGGFGWIQKFLLNELEVNNKWNEKRYFYGFLRSSIRRTIFRIGSIFILAIGIYLVRNESLTPGEFVSFLLIYFSSMWRITRIITIWNEVILLMRQVDELYVMMKKSVPIKRDKYGDKDVTSGSILISDLNFSYSNKEVLKEIHLNIESGEKILIVGKSGTGKSTLLKIIAGLYPINKGIIKVGNYNIDEISWNNLRENITFMSQDVLLFNESFIENIVIGTNKENNLDSVKLAARKAELHNEIMQKEKNYHFVIGDGGKFLSGGQRQRLSIARNLLKNPKIILLDEPTSSLDKVNTDKIFKTIFKEFEGKTILVVSHDKLPKVQFDRVFEIKEKNYRIKIISR